MSSKNTIADAQAILARAMGTLSLLTGVSPELLGESGTDLNAYRLEVAQLEAKVKALTEHLAAIAVLAPEVAQEARQIRTRNKQSHVLLRRVLKGKQVRHTKREAAPEETVAPASEAITPAPAKTRSRSVKR